MLIRLGPDHADFFAVVKEGNARGRKQHGSGHARFGRIIAQHTHDAILIVVGEEGGKLIRRISLPDCVLYGAQACAKTVARGVNHGTGQIKLEIEIQLAILDVLGHLFRSCSHLAHQQGVGVDRLHRRIVTLPPLVSFGGAGLLRAVFQDIARRVQAKTISSHLLQPKCADFIHFRYHVRVAIVEIRHAFPENTVVVAVAKFVPNPLVPGPQVGRIFVRPDIPIFAGGTGLLRFEEPGMLDRGVVEHHVNDDADAAFVSLGQQALEIVAAAVIWVDLVIVGDIVAVVTGGGHDGHEPEASDAQVMGGGGVAIIEVIQPGGEAIEIADAVAIGVIK